MVRAVLCFVCSAALGVTATAQTGNASKAMPLGKEVSTSGRAWLPGNFKVEIDGKVVPGIHVMNMDEVQVQADAERMRPGNHKPGKLTLTKDWSNTPEWAAWRKSVMDGRVDRKSISVIFMNDAGAEVRSFNFHDCFPIDYSAPDAAAKNSGHATEKLDISYETMEMK